jgi:hypothetical protein
MPTTASDEIDILEKAKRLLFTGDCLSGKEAKEWGLAIESAPPDRLDERFEILLERIARMPVTQLVMMKLLLNQSVMSQGLHTTQILGTVFDGITRHTREGYAFQQRAAEAGFRQAVRERQAEIGEFLGGAAVHQRQGQEQRAAGADVPGGGGGGCKCPPCEGGGGIEL